MNFKSGDVVRLKSSRPEMTVLQSRGDMVDCVWFQDGIVKRDSFPAATLEKDE